MEVTLLVLRLLLVVALYAFLGLIAALLWRDVRGASAREASSTAQARPARLVVLDPSDGASTADSYPLKPVTSIGRAPGNTIELTDTYCSAEHALVMWRASRWWIEDRGSRNGTLLNDVSIDTPVVLSGGDVVQIGRVRLRFEVESAG